MPSEHAWEGVSQSTETEDRPLLLAPLQGCSLGVEMKRGTDYRQAFVVLCGFSGPSGTSLLWTVTDFSLKEKGKEVRYHAA